MPEHLQQTFWSRFRHQHSGCWVNFQIIDGTAKKGQDFEENPGGTLVIPAGAAAGQITVSIKGDTKTEGAETFSVLLSGAVNATIADGQAQGTIGEDD